MNPDRRGAVLLICTTRLVTWCGWGVYVPFLAVWLHGLHVLGGTGIALVVGTAVIANRVGALPFVASVARYDRRTITIRCQWAAIAALAGMYLLGRAGSSALLGWLAAVLLFGLANSVGSLAQVAFIADQFDPGDGQRAFSYENVALNLGGGLAPLLSAVVLVHAPDQFAVVPAAFALLGIALAGRMPADRPHHEPASSAPPAAPALDRPGVAAFLLMNFLTMLAYTQFADVFPAYGSGVLGAERVGVLFTVSCVAIVVLQVPLTRLCARLGVARQVVAANLVAAVGALLLMDLAAGWATVCLAVCLLTVAEMVYGPLYQALAVQVFAGRTTTALGVVTFVWGLAESLATLVGLALVAHQRGSLSMLLGAVAATLVAALTTLPTTRRLLPAAAGVTAGAGGRDRG